MANTKQLQTKKATLLKQKASIEVLQASYAEKIATIETDIKAVDLALETEVAELQKMIDEIRNGVQPVAVTVVESDVDGDFN